MYGPLKWPLKTYFMEGDPTYETLSSTYIRDICSSVGSGTVTMEDAENRLEGLVPRETVKDIVAAYK